MTTRYPAVYNCMKAIERLSLRIRTHANFNNDILSASVIPYDVENIANFPHVNIVWDEERYLTVDDRSRTLNFEEKVVDVALHIFFKEKTDVQLRRALLVADFEKQFDKDRNFLLPDENGVPTCFNCTFASNVLYGTKQSAFYMLEMVLRVWYSTERGNPYQLV